jgi:hypothetical protein
VDVVLAVMTDSPYRSSVAKFAEEYAGSIRGRVRVLSLAHLAGSAGEMSARTPADDRHLDTVEAEAEHEAELLAGSAAPPVEGHWVLGPPVQECVKAIAECDLGVVGKTLVGKLPGGQGLGRQVAALERACTKPLVIVPDEVRPLRKVLFVYTDHPESGHALSLAGPLSEAGAQIILFVAIPPTGREELRGTGSAYLQEHRVTHETVESDCSDCEAQGGGAGPAGRVLHLTGQESIDLVVMGGTRRGFVGRMLWPDMASEVAWNIQVPLLIWY